ncbi:MAG: hypothetical protein AAF847_08280 [Bacteroidota bacterium]
MLLLAVMFAASKCSKEVVIDNITEAPEVVAADSAYANVYQVLDGKWKGTFKIFKDQDLQPKNEAALNNISLENLKKPTLKLSNSISVEQEYISESPYFQTVTIKDTYEENGEQKIVVSKGVNKVQNGEMWCVVRKPNETVIHKGSTVASEVGETIIWQSEHLEPLKVEYFYETVKSSTYEIIGYGYYEGDDYNLMPRLWFYGRYERQTDS